MKHLTTPVCDERKGRGSSVLRCSWSSFWSHCGAHTASLENTLAGQGIKAARGNKVCGQDRVSVKLEAPSQNVQEASPWSQQHFKETEEPLWCPAMPGRWRRCPFLISTALIDCLPVVSFLVAWRAHYNTLCLPAKSKDSSDSPALLCPTSKETLHWVTLWDSL